jgi:hypothetical protein
MHSRIGEKKAASMSFFQGYNFSRLLEERIYGRPTPTIRHCFSLWRSLETFALDPKFKKTVLVALFAEFTTIHGY